MITLKIVCYFVFCIMCLLGVNTSAQGFEGKVTFKIIDEETQGVVDYFVKEGKMRMEMSSDDGSIVILYDQSQNTTSMIMPEQKMYMEFKDIDDMQGDFDSDNTDIERTGEFKNINGYNCEKWIVKEEDEIIEAWMTDELGGFFMFNNPMMEDNEGNWQAELMGNYFPMRVDLIEGSEKQSVLEVVSVNEMSLNNDMFKVPAGFKKFDMPGMNKYDHE